MQVDSRGSHCYEPNVVVFGLGGIGLNVVQGARMVGADKIIGVDNYMDAKIDIDSLITEVMPLDQIETGVDRMRHGKSIRSVVTF